MRDSSRYSLELEHAFVSKNLVNYLRALSPCLCLAGARLRLVLRSRDVEALAGHDVKDASDHPDGPGARAFYRVAGSDGFRAVLLGCVREWWPRELVVDGEAKSFCPLEDVDAEFVQYNSCACIRVLDYVLSGKIPAHLVRNRELLRSVEQFRLGSSVAKRPASSMSGAGVVGKRVCSVS